MKTYILKRLLLMLPTMLGITIVTFGIIRLAPGDPAAMKVGSSAQGSIGEEQLAREIIEKTRAQFGLDKPIPVQYLLWLQRIVTLDFGRSYKDNRLVMDRIWERIPVTLQLNIISIFLVYLFAVPIGIFSSTHQYSFSDKAVTLFLFILYSLPSFWMATMLILYLGGGDHLHWFPITALSSLGASEMSSSECLMDRLWHLVLPVFCLTYAGLAYVSRQMRAGMLETIRQDYIRTADARDHPPGLHPHGAGQGRERKSGDL